MFAKITFGMIVLNGEPFLRYNLRSLYPFAHEIIVAEGASPFAAHAATPDGHSLDGTLNTLRRFKEEEDPENKVTIVTAEDEGYPDGFWPGEKNEQSQAYAKRATGDWLWQIDVDEFYRQADIEAICSFLASHNPSMVFFYFRMFMYHPQLEIHGVDPEYCQCQPIARIFRWGSGYRYVTHRPPTVVDDRGQNLRSLCLVTARETEKKGWYVWHYPYVYREQFESKARYYTALGLRSGIGDWVAKAQQMARPRFSVLWRGLSWTTACHEYLPEQVTSMFSSRCDYHLPGFTSSPSYRLLSKLALCHLAILRFMRLTLLGRWWIRSYRVTTSRPWQPSNQPRRVGGFKRILRKSHLFRLAVFLGWVGYHTF